MNYGPIYIIPATVRAKGCGRGICIAGSLMNIFSAKRVGGDKATVYINAAHIVCASFNSKGLKVDLVNGQSETLKMAESEFQTILYSNTGEHGSLESGDFWYVAK